MVAIIGKFIEELSNVFVFHGLRSLRNNLSVFDQINYFVFRVFLILGLINLTHNLTTI